MEMKIIKTDKYTLLCIILSSFILIALIYKVITVNQFPIQQRKDASGLPTRYMAELFPAWYQYDLYPLNLNVVKRIQEKIIHKLTRSLGLDTSIKMAPGGLVGEFLRLPYMLPNYIFKLKPSPKLSNQLISIISIIFLLIIGYKRKQIWFVFFILISIILTDYFIYENFFRENIFGVSISAFLIVFSLLTFLNKSIKTNILILIVISSIISTLANVRTELYFLLPSVIIYLLFNEKIKYALLKIMFICFFVYLLSYLISSEMIKKIEKTNEVIAEVNGAVWKGPIMKNHAFFHSLWLGLGDNKYGREFGIKWLDRIAHERVAYLRPDIYKLSDMDGSRVRKYYDENNVYAMYPVAIPGYAETLRSDIWQKFTKYPIKFILIYYEKFKNNITRLSSIHINPNYASPSDRNKFNFINYLFRSYPPSKSQYRNEFFIFSGNLILTLSSIIIISLIIIKKINQRIYNYKIYDKFQLSFIFSSLPLAIPAVIISDLGATYNSIFHFGLLAMALCLMLKYLLK